MSKCETCRKQNHSYLCDGCIHDKKAVDKYEPKTNADRIRAMTDEELAVFLCNGSDCAIGYCYGAEMCKPGKRASGLIEWLQQPAEGD